MCEDVKVKIKSLFKDKLCRSFDGGTICRLGGLTNFNYKVELPNESFVVRYPGNGTEGLINRYEEYLSTKLTNEISIDAENIYFDPDTGIKVSRFIEDAVTLNSDTIKEQSNMKLIAELFNQLHNCDKGIPVAFDVFEKIIEYENLLKSEPKDYFWEDYSEMRQAIYNLKSLYKSYRVSLVMCHNDPLCETFILGKDRMYLVDWEYAGMNDPMWDLADVFIEGNFSEAEESQFKEYYFNRKSTKEEDQRILMNKVFLDFLWSLWGKQRYACGEDLLDYANERYERAKQNLNILTELNTAV